VTGACGSFGHAADATVAVVANHEEVRFYRGDGTSFLAGAPFKYVPHTAEPQVVTVTAGPNGLFVVKIGWWLDANAQGSQITALDAQGEVLWVRTTDAHMDSVMHVGADRSTVLWRNNLDDWKMGYAEVVADDGRVTQLPPTFRPMAAPTAAGLIAGHLEGQLGWFHMAERSHTALAIESHHAFVLDDQLIYVNPGKTVPWLMTAQPGAEMGDLHPMWAYEGQMQHLGLGGIQNGWILFYDSDTEALTRINAHDGFADDAVVLSPPEGFRRIERCMGSDLSIDADGRILTVLRDDAAASLWRFDVDAQSWEQLGQSASDIVGGAITPATHTAIVRWYGQNETYCPHLEFSAPEGDAAALTGAFQEIVGPGEAPTTVLAGGSEVIADPTGLCVAYQERGVFGEDLEQAPQLLDVLSGETLPLEGWGSVAFAQ